MGRVVVIVLAIALTIYCWIEIRQAGQYAVRRLPKWMWALVVIVPFAGAAGWFIWGRPRDERPPLPGESRPIAPDDDPDFLGRL